MSGGCQIETEVQATSARTRTSVCRALGFWPPAVECCGAVLVFVPRERERGFYGAVAPSRWGCGDEVPDAREDVRGRGRLLDRERGGERAFKVDGKALRVRDTLVLEDASSGGELYEIQEKKLAIRDKMEIERGGATVATVKKALITPLRDRFSIEVEGGEDMEAKGNIVDHEYEIERGGDKVAEVSKRWFRVRDTYGIEIAPEQDDALILAVSVCIDQMARG